MDEGVVEVKPSSAARDWRDFDQPMNWIKREPERT